MDEELPRHDEGAAHWMFPESRRRVALPGAAALFFGGSSSRPLLRRQRSGFAAGPGLAVGMPWRADPRRDSSSTIAANVPFTRVHRVGRMVTSHD